MTLPLADLQLDELDTATPNGNTVRFLVRHGSNDHNTVASLSVFDEYGLRGLPQMSGWALDIGAHVGGVGVCLAIDNPELNVIAIEPVPDNAQLCRVHAERNGLGRRFKVIEGAVGKAGTTTLVRYGFKVDAGDPFDHHAWIGNTSLVYVDPPVESHMEVEVPCISLAELAYTYEALGPPAIVKVDCEGGEWDALPEIVALSSPRVVGEWHPVCGRGSADELVDAFSEAGYEVTTTGPAAGPGGFLALLP